MDKLICSDCKLPAVCTDGQDGWCETHKPDPKACEEFDIRLIEVSARRFMHFEDNGDDTITFTIGENGQEHVFVLAFGFDTLHTAIPHDIFEESQTFVEGNFIQIPNSPEE